MDRPVRPPPSPQTSRSSQPWRKTPNSSTPRRSHYSNKTSSSRRSVATPVLMVSDTDGDGGSLILSSGGGDDDEIRQPAWYTPERHLIAIKFVYFFVYANTACLIPYFVTYYYEWGLTPTELSLIQAAVPFFGFLVRPIIGRIADVTNHHRAVFAACCLWCAFFHIPHMFIPKLIPPCNSDDMVCSGNTSLVANCSAGDADQSASSRLFSDPDRLPTLTLLLGLRLVAYAGQAPTQDLADAFCYAATDRDPRRWGRQRVWSTVGWAIATFSVGFVINELGTHYWLFIITAFFNVCAAISIMFLAPLGEGSPAMVSHGGAGHGGGNGSTSRNSSSHHRRPQTASSSTTGAFSMHSSRLSTPFSLSSTVDTGTPILRTPPPRRPQVTLTMLLKQKHVQIYLLFAMMSGSLLAIEFSFLLIFLKQNCGDELLIGLHQAVDSFSEFPLFLFSGYIITWLGFVPCFCLSFATYIVRLISYSFLTDPLYLVLLVEIIHCFSFTLYVAAGTGYADSITAPGLEATLQSLFQGVFFGLGYGAGNLIGGFLYPVIGARWLFRGGAIVAAICGICYVTIYLSGILKTRPTSATSTSNVSRTLINDTLASPSPLLAYTGHAMSIKTIDSTTLADTASLGQRSNTLLIPPSAPIPSSELFLAPDGLHRSPALGRVPMIVLMTPLTARIVSRDGIIRYIDE